jgi:hypothetical protein
MLILVFFAIYVFYLGFVFKKMGTISSTRKNSKSNAQNVLNNNQKELIKHNNNSPLQQQTSSLPNDQENIDRAAATAHTLLVKTTTRTPKPCVSTTFKQAPFNMYLATISRTHLTKNLTF